ncbi:hypothetical protein FB451DRAFT_1047871 [Mycena latifolia]|nr:hypothetical protein FB451DRAFT_1047871 [Mycena latifolia]
MLEAFKIKPFDLEPVYAAWPAGPRFLGDPKKDPPVDEWLQEIKGGCIERNVPQEYWHTCAQHFMGDQAKARLVELKKVMAQVHGGRYRWNWKKFKVAMRNMSWDIDTSETETVKVTFWPWMPKSKPDSKSEEEWQPVICDEPIPTLSRSNTFTRLFTKDSSTSPEPERPVVERAVTHSSFWPVRRNSKEVEASHDTFQRPVPRKAKSEGTGVSTVRAPAWLLNAATALDFLSSEHPKVMTTLSAILIVAGTIPNLPGIAAGAGGAVLASSTAHAVGAIAVGLGNWMQTQQEIQSKKSKGEGGK